jgi:O-antigen ligase
LKARDERRARFKRWLFAGALGVAAAVGVGVASFALPVSIVVALLLAAGSLVCLLAARRYVHGVPIAAPASTPLKPDPVASRGGDFRVPRLLYYAGMLTIAQTAFRPLGGFTVSDWLFFAALCAALAAAAVRGVRLPFWIPPVVLLGGVMYVASGLVASVGAEDPGLSVALVARFAYLTLVWFWLGTVVLTRQRHVRTAVAMWVLSVAIDGAAAILQARGVGIPYLSSAESGRMSGLAESTNALGGAAAIAVAPAFALSAVASMPRRQVVSVLLLLFIVAAIVLSGSVTGMAAGMAAAGVWLVVTYRGARALVVALAALTLAAGVAQLQSNVGLATPVQRLLSTTGQSEGGRYSTVAMRVQGYEAAWEAVGSGGLLGHGLLAGYNNALDARYVHNLVLKAWYEAGWSGGVGMACVLFGGLAYTLMAARRAVTEQMRLLAVGMFGAMIAFVIFAMSNPLLSQRYGWVPLALAIAALSLSRRGAVEPVESMNEAGESMAEGGS